MSNLPVGEFREVDNIDDHNEIIVCLIWKSPMILILIFGHVFVRIFLLKVYSFLFIANTEHILVILCVFLCWLWDKVIFYLFQIS